jgi:methylated-DNA-[protein]-cysteine S-methyltransferase
MTANHQPPLDLRQAFPVTGTDLATLHDRLAQASDDQDLLDVAYRVLDTPVGPLLLAATPAGLVRIAYRAEGHDQVLQAIAARLSPRVLHAPRRLDAAAHELDEYFAGRRRGFDLPLDYSLANGFRRLVLGYLPGIGYGQTACYSAVAAGLGSPRAVRAVAAACAANPLPVVVPCHRVIGKDGSLTGYIGGLPAKRLLLDLEGKRTLPAPEGR